MGQPSSFLDQHIKLKLGESFELKDFDKNTQQHFKSMRLRDGQEFLILNGAGKSWKLSRNDKIFNVIEEQSYSRQLPEFHLFLSPPSSDALSLSVQQSTEMGVHSFHFFFSDYCQYKKSKNLNFDRLKRVAAASCAQCLQPWLPHFDETPKGSLKEALSSAEGLCLIADEDTFSSYSSQAEFLQETLKGHEKVSIFIGPEGGWSPPEHKIIEEQCESLSLGPHILRVPTACVAALAIIRESHS